MIFRFMMILSRIACLFPESVGRTIAAGLGMTASRIWIPERSRILETMDRVYHRLGKHPPRPLFEIIDRMFIHFSLVAYESLRFPLLTTDLLQTRMVFHGVENLEAALAPGKGVILAVPHLGSWEMLGAAIAHRGYPLHSFYLAQKENDIGTALDYFRGYSKIVLHDRDRGGLGALKALKYGEALGMIADQDGGNHGVYIDFLGHWVSMPAGPANWSLKLGAALVPLYCLRQGRSTQYDAWFFPALGTEQGRNHEERVIARTRRLSAMTESWILAHPDQYLWFYDRFKPRHHVYLASLKTTGMTIQSGDAVYRPSA
ncbi:MAG: lysophospholipid acyltransferase family protein [Candidatus Riflebacteria bacterium]|nr:lysophospholipid acyltransferase family protein [Candidatus Riflebacteria bacterium]